ncbi:class I SAM-dependent methyltransferase [Planomicrobium okeanokoites]|uniref:Class I SAM-dependent methyltransferase n=1 Tax=Planomicrobium okeanokoites TaxID=244 RepID=A0ABV7KRX1_PLAOK|nr:class I SAM-dependent methyltransferase [Planomicrobium okeanokoites]TAA70004.1 class I SAM-dependent methyltransferase [Planomicrobium okeanokoites]
MVEKRFNPEQAAVLYSEERKALLPPESILAHLKLNGDEEIADLGAGNGYFTLPLASKTKNQVYAVDIEPKMLALLQELAEKGGLANIRYIESDLESIRLKDRSVDKVMAAFVIHEVPDPAKALKEIKRILKPDGTLLLIEWEAVETEIGPPLEDKIPSADMADLLKENGFTQDIIQLNEKNYGIIAKLA